MILVAAAETASLDLGNITGLSIGALLLALVFRTLWQQDGAWRSVLTASREDAAQARKEAAEARTDAAAAREDARVARNAERECQRRLAKLEDRLEQVRSDAGAAIDRVARKVDELHPDGPISGEIPTIPPSSGD